MKSRVLVQFAREWLIPEVTELVVLAYRSRAGPKDTARQGALRTEQAHVADAGACLSVWHMIERLNRPNKDTQMIIFCRPHSQFGFCPAN